MLKKMFSAFADSNLIEREHEDLINETIQPWIKSFSNQGVGHD